MMEDYSELYPAWEADSERLHRKSGRHNRNGRLNQRWFADLEEARAVIDDWRRHYNQVRPHSSLTSAAGSIRQTGSL